MTSRSPEAYEEMIRAMGDGLYAMDLDGRYTEVNDRFLELTGYDRSDLLGESSADLLDEATADRFERAIRRLLVTEDRASETVEATLSTAGGDSVRTEITLTLLHQDGAVAGTTGVVRDVSEREAQLRELRSTGAMLSTLLATIPAGILAEDGTGRVLFTNSEFTDLFGLETEPAELIGLDGAGFEHRFADADRGTEAVGSRGPTRREELLLDDGRTVERNGTPLHLDEGDTGTLWVYHDVTDRKRAENRFRALFEHLPDPAVIVELAGDDAITTAVNGAFEEVFGYAAETAVGASLNDLIVPPSLEAESKELNARSRSGEQLVTELRRRTADGEVRDFLFRNVLMERVGENPRSHGIYTDITERKQRERRLDGLHESTRDLMAADTCYEVADAASVAARNVLKLPLNGVHLYDEEAGGLVPRAASPETLDLVGTPPTFRPGGSIAWAVYESGVPQSFADVRNRSDVYDAETAVRSELLLPLGDHGILLIGSTAVDDFTDVDRSLANVLAANVTIALDRTKREQELQRQNERLEEFASVLSHDLRNPLNVATGHLSLARDDGLAGHAEAIDHALRRMERIIADVLELARQGYAVERRQSVALETVVRSAWASVDTGAATLRVETDRPMAVDVGRVSQLFENLFRNAVEHAGGDATVTVGSLDDGFYVADDGPGIPDGHLDRVFETGYSSSEEGTGFGLSIVREVATAHGWTVDVRNRSDGGARFDVTGLQRSE